MNYPVEGDEGVGGAQQYGPGELYVALFHYDVSQRYAKQPPPPPLAPHEKCVLAHLSSWR